MRRDLMTEDGMMPTSSTIMKILNFRLLKTTDRLRSFLIRPSSFKVIPHAPLGVHILGVSREGLYLFAKAPDMHINGTLVSGIIPSLDKVQQILPAVNLLGMAEEKLENIEFLRGQVDLVPCDINSSVRDIKL